MILTGEKLKNSQKNLSHCYFIQHMSHMDCPESEPWSVPWDNLILHPDIYTLIQSTAKYGQTTKFCEILNLCNFVLDAVLNMHLKKV